MSFTLLVAVVVEGNSSVAGIMVRVKQNFKLILS